MAEDTEFTEFRVVEVPHGFYAVHYCVGHVCGEGSSWVGVHALEHADTAEEAEGVLDEWRGEEGTRTCPVCDGDGELWDERAAWQEASGLLVGGDPDGVEPRHLERFVGLSAALEAAARRVLGDAHSVLTTEDAGSALWDLRVAIRALDALDAFAREEGSPGGPRLSA